MFVEEVVPARHQHHRNALRPGPGNLGTAAAAVDDDHGQPAAQPPQRRERHLAAPRPTHEASYRSLRDGPHQLHRVVVLQLAHGLGRRDRRRRPLAATAADGAAAAAVVQRRLDVQQGDVDTRDRARLRVEQAARPRRQITRAGAGEADLVEVDA
jgi:hypothetical protein